MPLTNSQVSHDFKILAAHLLKIFALRVSVKVTYKYCCPLFPVLIHRATLGLLGWNL